MSLISVEDARRLILDGVVRLPAENCPIFSARGKTLAGDIAALRTQPPFDASAMDGYAVRAADIASVPARLTVIGESAAGRAFQGTVGPGQTARIFTGAPLPAGADSVVIQENTQVPQPGEVDILANVPPGRNVRRAGLDFSQGEVLLKGGKQLDWRDIALAAAMDWAELPVVRRPRIAILATGDELVEPGNPRTKDQIVASNSYGLAAYIDALGGEPIDLGIVGDDHAAISARLRGALALEPDVIVTLGGASVGDHDLVGAVLREAGIALAFWKIAMRPGKPLMFGNLGAIRVLGLPGNPVSSLVGAIVFLEPLIATLLGQEADERPKHEQAILGSHLKENDGRADYLRATLQERDGTPPVATPFDTQDSSMLSTFVHASCLILRSPNAQAAVPGDICRIIRL